MSKGGCLNTKGFWPGKPAYSNQPGILRKLNNYCVRERFNAMMEAGASQPWPDTLEEFTGTREMDGSAIIEYFQPLIEHLEEENEGRTCGWAGK